MVSGPEAATSQSYVPAAKRVAVSGYFLAVADFPLRTYKLRVSRFEKLSRFGTVSLSSYEQAITRLSWLSYSPPGFPGRRSLSLLRCRVSPRSRSPRSQRCTVHSKMDTGPVDRICTCFVCDGLPVAGLSESPRFTHESDRTTRLLSRGECFDTKEAIHS